MQQRITATELARSLSDVLSRVHYKGESFVIERNGELVATLEPPDAKPAMTLRELLTRLRDRHLLPVDDRFADDLESVQASQPTVPPPPSWDN